jgi:hypothetical protein
MKIRFVFYDIWRFELNFIFYKKCCLFNIWRFDSNFMEKGIWRFWWTYIIYLKGIISLNSLFREKKLKLFFSFISEMFLIKFKCLWEIVLYDDDDD